MNYDPLQIANDNILHQLLEQLQGHSRVKGHLDEGLWAKVKFISEWVLYLFLETLKIMIEILL